MITTERVTVRDIEPGLETTSSAGRTYKYTSLTVRNSAGSVSEKKILDSTLNKAPEMKEVLNTVKRDDIVTLVLETREGTKFSNIVGVYKGDVPDATSQVTEGGKTWNNKGSSNDGIGAQIGNALKLAGVLLAHKVVRGDLRETAEMVLYLSEELKSNLLSGKYKKNEPTVQKTTINQTINPDLGIVDDDDLVF